MLNQLKMKMLILAVVPMAAVSLFTAAPAEAKRRVVVHRVYPRPYIHPFYYSTGVHIVYHRIPENTALARQGLGKVDFNVKPKDSLVYVDGRLLGKVDDFDGSPQKAILRSGEHRVRIETPSGRTFRSTIFVQPGKELNLDWDL